jgi:hypothetical protein
MNPDISLSLITYEFYYSDQIDGWVRHIARMGYIWNFFSENVKRSLGRPTSRWEDAIQMDLKRDKACGLNSSGSEQQITWTALWNSKIRVMGPTGPETKITMLARANSNLRNTHLVQQTIQWGMHIQVSWNVRNFFTGWASLILWARLLAISYVWKRTNTVLMFWGAITSCILHKGRTSGNLRTVGLEIRWRYIRKSSYSTRGQTRSP